MNLYNHHHPLQRKIFLQLPPKTNGLVTCLGYWRSGAVPIPCFRKMYNRELLNVAGYYFKYND